MISNRSASLPKNWQQSIPLTRSPPNCFRVPGFAAEDHRFHDLLYRPGFILVYGPGQLSFGPHAHGRGLWAALSATYCSPKSRLAQRHPYAAVGAIRAPSWSAHPAAPVSPCSNWPSTRSAISWSWCRWRPSSAGEDGLLPQLRPIDLDL